MQTDKDSGIETELPIQYLYTKLEPKTIIIDIGIHNNHIRSNFRSIFFIQQKSFLT